MINKKEILFPYSKIRQIQDFLIQDVINTIKNKNNLIVHAPTGLGKTAATLSPALSFALKKDLTVFFLTSRHTHTLYIQGTINKISE